jgi:putative transposase
MSEKYKIRDQSRQYFITFATAGWIDVFTRRDYKDIFLESVRYCQREKGLVVYAWCLMTNHVHMIIGRAGEAGMEEIIRDLKKFTATQICKAIESNPQESRREWMLDLFRKYGAETGKHHQYKFWQGEFHPIELNTNEMMDERMQYIHYNPVEAGIVYEPESYRYSSAIDYGTMRKGLLEIEYIE